MIHHYDSHVDHTIPIIYCMPGERAILKISNQDHTWSDSVAIFPHP